MNENEIFEDPLEIEWVKLLEILSRDYPDEEFSFNVFKKWKRGIDMYPGESFVHYSRRIKRGPVYPKNHVPYSLGPDYRRNNGNNH